MRSRASAGGKVSAPGGGTGGAVSAAVVTVWPQGAPTHAGKPGISDIYTAPGCTDGPGAASQLLDRSSSAIATKQLLFVLSRCGIFCYPYLIPFGHSRGIF